ncbi:MAG TPA: hypothetical protein VEX68_07785 [Bryobacteraceae bacterium]|nr:hypothetical protein [Bryobacteraceae bacterium]
MNILWAMLGGLAGGALLCISSFFLGAWYAEASNMSNMEGARGYFAVAMGMIGAVAGLPAGIILTLRRRRNRGSAGNLVVGSLSSVAGVVAVGILGVGIWWMMQPKILAHNGPTPLLDFEVMPSMTMKTIDLDRLVVELQTDHNGADGVWKRDHNREENGRQIFAGYVPLYFRTSQRMLVIKVPNGEAQIFRLRLASDPTGLKYRTWTDWQSPDFVDNQKGSSQPMRAVPEHSFSIRYRVETAD